MPYDLSTKHRRIESPEPSTESSSSICSPPPTTPAPIFPTTDFINPHFLPIPFHPAMSFYFSPLMPQTFTPQVLTHHDVAIVPGWSSPPSSVRTPSPVTYHEQKCDDRCCSPKSPTSPQSTSSTSCDGKKEFSCKYCDKSYVSMGALKMHIRTHTLPCKCDICGKAFSRPWLLQGHIRTHTGEKPFQCEHCNRAFADRSNLRAHLQTHQQIKKYSCKKCSKTFSRMSLLQKHQDSLSCSCGRNDTDISR